MSRSFYNDFVNEVIKPKYSTIIFKIKSNLRKTHCLVEGVDDQKFYRNFLYKKLNKFKDDLRFIVCGNKRNVMDATKSLYFNEPRLYKNGTYYIVDADYDSESVYDDEYYKRLTVLNYYSIENFFFTDENLEIIFLQILKLSEEHLNKFKSLYLNYIKDILPYQTLKMINTLHEKEIINLKSIDLSNGYIIDNRYIINENWNDEIKVLVDSFKSKEKYNRYIYKTNYEFLKNNHNYISGHDIEIVFNKYITQFDMNIQSIKDLFKHSDKLLIKINLK